MITPQRETGSGFGARTTANEVLKGIDLTGKTMIVTGGHSGLGLSTTRALAGAGAHVLILARRPESAAMAVEDISGVEVDELDLSDLASVRRFADRFLSSDRAVHALIANAGIMACPQTRVGPGWEAQFATNHVGHFALVNLLWPALVRGRARVVAVSSGAHHGSGVRWDDIHFNRGYDKWLAYSQSKTANVLFAVQLDRLGGGAGVHAFSLHPGSILTPLQRHLPKEDMVAAGWIDENGNLADPSFKTPEQGAATQVWAATSPQLAGMGGVYCKDCDVADATEVAEHATDPAEADRLWELSATLTGIDAFAKAG
jgi:NAD(P)-dependent dehydrogenase (short-subunit alcohol dehydrogenase family)